MKHIPLVELGDCFQSLERPARRAVMTALVERFQPSDYRALASICFPQLYVGDLVQILPSEVVDLIFAYCEPQDIFKFRNVSTIWNHYLTQPEFLQRMDHKMYANGGQYLLDSDIIDGKRRSFEECVRHRYALLNGRACKFEHIQNPEEEDQILFHSGTLVQWTDISSYIYVRRLSRGDTEWINIGDELDHFYKVTLTARHIVACKWPGELYCWDSASLDLVAHFWLTSVPELVTGPRLPDRADDYLVVEVLEATSDTIILVSEDVWFLYSLNKKTLTRMDLFRYEKPQVQLFRTETDQSGYFYVCDGLDEEPHIDVLKIDGTNSSISVVRRIDLNALARQQLGTDWTAAEAGSSRDAFEIVVVLDHSYMCGTCTNVRSEDTQEVVFEMKDGIVTYHHTVESSTRRLIYHPQMHMAFAANYDEELKMPLGLDQVKDKTCRPVPLGQSKLRTRHDLKTALKADLTEEGLDDLRSGLRANMDHQNATFGDGNFVIWSLGGFTKVWRFFGIDTDRPTAG